MPNIRSGGGGAGAAASIVVGNPVTGGGANRVLFEDASQNLATSASLAYSDTGSPSSTPMLTIGTGSGTSQGVSIGANGSGIARIWPTGVTAGSTNFFLTIRANGDNLINIPTTGNALQLNVAGSTTKWTQNGTAGEGPAFSAGTAASAVSAMSLTQTRNFAGSATNYTSETYTETATNAADYYKRILAGSAGNSPVYGIPLGGGLQLGTSGLTAAQGTSWIAIKHATATLASVTGATVTATNLIPAKANVLGVNTVVTVALGTGSGTTGYTVGDGSDVDRWGAVTGTAAGTDTDGNDATANPTGWFTAANNVVITAAGGNFDGTGSIFVHVMYTLTEAT